MQLGRLTRLGRAPARRRVGGATGTNEELEEILNNDTQLRAVIKNELSEVREEHDTPVDLKLCLTKGIWKLRT